VLIKQTGGKVKVKLSHYRPGQAQGVLRKLRYPDFVTMAQDGGKVVSLTHWPKQTGDITKYTIRVKERIEICLLYLYEALHNCCEHGLVSPAIYLQHYSTLVPAL